MNEAKTGWDILLTDDPQLQKLLEVLDTHLSEKGIDAYLVGGFIRDSLLGRSVADIDIAVRADAREIANGVAELLHGKDILDIQTRLPILIYPLRYLHIPDKIPP